MDFEFVFIANVIGILGVVVFAEFEDEVVGPGVPVVY